MLKKTRSAQSSLYLVNGFLWEKQLNHRQTKMTGLVRTKKGKYNMDSKYSVICPTIHNI